MRNEISLQGADKYGETTTLSLRVNPDVKVQGRLFTLLTHHINECQ